MDNKRTEWVELEPCEIVRLLKIQREGFGFATQEKLVYRAASGEPQVMRILVEIEKV